MAGRGRDMEMENGIRAGISNGIQNGSRAGIRIQTVIFLMLGMLCCGCGNGKSGNVPEETYVDLMQETEAEGAAAGSGAEQGEPEEVFCADTADFGIRLLQENLKRGDGRNVIVSPAAVLDVLAVAANGAEGDTLSQINSVIAENQDMEQLNRNRKAWADSLGGTGQAGLYLADSVWLKQTDEAFSVKEEFLEKNASFYGMDLYGAAFDTDTVEDMNNWVNEKTGGRIPRILDRIPEEAVMYLLNTASFEAEWERTYKEYEIKSGTFTGASGEKKTVPFLYSGERVYIEGENAVGFVKPYKEDYYFAAVLPAEGVRPEEYAASLDGEGFRSMLAEAKTEKIVKTGMPKFEAAYEVRLNDILRAMGIEDAFDRERADFSGIGTYADGNLFIDEILHKTYIAVNELGTEATAATEMSMAAEAAEEDSGLEIYYVYLNRPFIYAIVEDRTNVPVFIGVVNEVGE